MCIMLMYMGSLYAHSRVRFGGKGLLVVFLALLGMGLGVCDVLAQGPTSDAKQDGGVSSEDTQAQDEKKPFWLGGQKHIDRLGSQDETDGALQTMIVYSVIILVLGVVAVLVVKRVLPKIQRSAGKNISILETVYISPRSSVHLLRVGTKKYLVSRSGEGVCLLADVTEALPVEPSVQGDSE